MIAPPQWIHGVECIWLAWLAGVVVVLKMSAHALRRWQRPCWQELARGEEGVSYTLSYVLTAPIYFFFVCLVFEASWLLVAKVGTLYAAHAGARSAVVWSSARPEDWQTDWSNDQLEAARNQRIGLSVRTAMTPFVTGRLPEVMTPDILWVGGVDGSDEASEYASAYLAYTNAGSEPNAAAMWQGMRDRYRIAAARTIWQRQESGSGASVDLTVTVTYRAPLHIPGVSRFLDPDGQPPYEYSITSSATLPSEVPTSDDHTLGIDYRSR